ncbi:lactococcin 972 family bacteriocin [Enterococcus sp. RIT-PI-f]|uniref:lactococcin 972 family bacteriocin n=1 Tax=Enterococcus sp. RIT-PI-f TaxID=1690244 RepID=UPI003569AC26
MKVKKKIITGLFVATTLLAFATPAFAVQGGNWSYGGHHDPTNWGAFSNYYHPTRWHWSSVTRHRDSRSNRGTANANATSRAFINTNLGERASFDFGF